MLKFADLSVDFKSYENSLNSYMKLFPGSYTPLLIMYLAHKGLLNLVHDFEENDPRILVSVEGKSLHDFFGDGIMKELIQDPKVWKLENMTFEETVEQMNKAILKDRDVYVMLPFIHLWPSILAGKSIALIADISKDNQINDLIDCITISDHAYDNPAALMFFSVMLMMKYQPYPDDDNDDKDVKSPKEIEYDKRIAQGVWTEDFDNTLSSIMSYAGDNLWIQPDELTRVILTQYKGGSIYNPFAGLASYAIQLHYECGVKCHYLFNNIGDYYYGEEIQDLAWAIGKLRLLAYDSDSKNYTLGDSTEWCEGVVDNVLSTPPFIQIENENGKKEFADHFVIRRGIETLADDGLLACVVPLSFLYRKDTEQLRKRIVDSGWLETIVYLPEKLFNNTDIRTAIVFIRKTEHKGVKLVNATNAIYKKSRRINVLDEEMVANLLYHNSYPYHEGFLYDEFARMDDDLPESKFEKLKSYAINQSIAKKHYDLSPGRYFVGKIPSIEGYRLIKLSDIVESTPNSVGTSGKGKVIRPALLSMDSFTSLVSDTIPEEEFKKQYKEVNRDALLFSPLASLRPTLFANPNKECVYLKSDTVHAVYLKSDVINPEYLIIELNKPYVQEQIRLLTKGDVIPRLGLEDFLSIQIYVPNSRSKALSLEKEYVEQQKSLYYSKINAELAALKDKQYDEYVKMLRQRKHRIQQVMNEFSPAFSMLNQLRKENGGVLHDNDIVAARTGKTVGEYFEKLESIVAKVEDLVTNLIDKELWKEPKPVDMVQFVKSIPQSHISDKYMFQIDAVCAPEYSSNILLPYYSSSEVLIAPDDLSTIFDNIINNAIKHGFTDDIRRDYVVRISLISDVVDNDPCVKFFVSNNGTPIHPSVDRDRFFDWGYGTNTGIGTWQIKSIVEHYGGSVELKENPDDAAGFQTEYVIVLPLIDKEIWKIE